MNAVGPPACTHCRAPLPPGAFNLGRFIPCHSCGAELWVEAFAALIRPVARGDSGEAVMLSGESACFYHENKKATVVCNLCGRFLCGLCDCELNGEHFCPACLETGRKKRTIDQLETMRMLYARQAFMLSILPLFITGIIALFIAARYWKAPDSLVSPKRWMMPAALIFGTVQTIGFSILLFLAFTR